LVFAAFHLTNNKTVANLVIDLVVGQDPYNSTYSTYFGINLTLAIALQVRDPFKESAGEVRLTKLSPWSSSTLLFAHGDEIMCASLNFWPPSPIHTASTTYYLGEFVLTEKNVYLFSMYTLYNM
jgi:hypothetical protein